MIVVTCHTLDTPGGVATYNGAYALHFYNLNEALAFAQTESLPLEGSGVSTSVSWCRVYNDGQKLADYVNGTLQ
jgi:hypothetical protein